MIPNKHATLLRAQLWAFAILLVAVAIVASVSRQLRADDSPEDPTAWGTDHVSEAVPNYGSGTECLFCHRDFVAPRWINNPHNKTMRTPEAMEPSMVALAEAKLDALKPSDVEILLGDGDNVRFLKKLPEYGKAAISSVAFEQQPNTKPRDCLLGTDKPVWDEKLFAEKCAGCHATGIDTETASMSATSLECYVCHGLTDIEHSVPENFALLSGKQPIDARVEISICGQCHLRGGKSKTTKRPYPTNFVAGDNLLRDFQVEFSEPVLETMDVIDRHVFVNARDVLIRGQGTLTCTSCHQIHTNSSQKHAELDEVEYCAICHKPGGDFSKVELPGKRSNTTCGYGLRQDHR